MGETLELRARKLRQVAEAFDGGDACTSAQPGGEDLREHLRGVRRSDGVDRGEGGFVPDDVVAHEERSRFTGPQEFRGERNRLGLRVQRVCALLHSDRDSARGPRDVRRQDEGGDLTGRCPCRDHRSCGVGAE